MEQEEKKRIKHGGRKKGTPNKVTHNVRAWLERIIRISASSIEADLNNMLPKDRCDFIAKILPYVISKKSEITATIDYNQLTEEQVATIINQINGDGDETE